MAQKKTLATTSLAGCFGCHMSFLDMDTRLIDFFELVELDKSPLNDIKEFTRKIDIGFIEGGVCNTENVRALRSFRKNCRILVCVGECAIMGGLPALRNNIPLQECLEEAYIKVPTTQTHEATIPNHEDIPKILDKVYPCHEVVKIDHYIPGCPPSADTLWATLTALVEGREPSLDYGLLKYD
jgi:NAD-reducing hydrogenase small subunit